MKRLRARMRIAEPNASQSGSKTERTHSQVPLSAAATAVATVFANVNVVASPATQRHPQCRPVDRANTCAAKRGTTAGQPPPHKAVISELPPAQTHRRERLELRGLRTKTKSEISRKSNDQQAPTRTDTTEHACRQTIAKPNAHTELAVPRGTRESREPNARDRTK